MVIGKQGAGRPRGFDEDEVLDAALLIFWDKGYEGASLDDLMTGMKLTKSSLYKAFGSKEALFRRAVDRYRRDHLAFRADALAKEPSRAIVAALLTGIARLHTGPSTPPGCLETNAALACSDDGDGIREALIGSRERFRRQLRDRFDALGDAAALPPGLSSDETASYVFAVIQGMAVQAKSGASRDTLLGIVRATMLAWPAA
ncbi:TetR family transcriptional regulator [Sphingomonas sp. Leaf412]|uniref:TetR/AcrR family transcriptional regulator n=1 Tax=Sphingomonas sp. Leaf412 TaxID=1736370 RepID=UPI0007013DA7|nr:TetR/AcrR family transcriptional regulator [Sphingomonas sp. Leaf412]KQT31419.1 TetR family transcriptional regulator [Sphingomonas sp. Leaf412]